MTYEHIGEAPRREGQGSVHVFRSYCETQGPRRSWTKLGAKLFTGPMPELSLATKWSAKKSASHGFAPV